MTRQANRSESATRGRPPREGLRDHLLKHTLKVLLRDGYQKFSMSAVAVSAKASKETLYRHFGDKAGLLAAALARIGEGVTPVIMAGIEPGMSVEQRLQLLGRNYLQGLLLPVSLALQRIAYADGDQGLGPLFARQFSAEALKVVTAQFDAMRTPHPALDAEIFLAMVQGQVHEQALLGVGGGDHARSEEEVVAHAVAVFMAYLVANSVSGTV